MTFHSKVSFFVCFCPCILLIKGKGLCILFCIVLKLSFFILFYVLVACIVNVTHYDRKKTKQPMSKCWNMWVKLCLRLKQLKIGTKQSKQFSFTLINNIGNRKREIGKLMSPSIRNSTYFYFFCLFVSTFCLYSCFVIACLFFTVDVVVCFFYKFFFA